MKQDTIEFRIQGNEPPAELFRSYRRMIVGPWVKQPEYYEGYNGFVGWAGITRLKSGRWLMTFTSGYWHFSPPLTPDILKDQACKKYYDQYHIQNTMPFIIAPTGGCAHIMFSDDEGRTWSNPETLINTDKDNRHPTILELKDNTLLYSVRSLKVLYLMILTVIICDQLTVEKHGQRHKNFQTNHSVDLVMVQLFN